MDNFFTGQSADTVETPGWLKHGILLRPVSCCNRRSNALRIQIKGTCDYGVVERQSNELPSRMFPLNLENLLHHWAFVISVSTVTVIRVFVYIPGNNASEMYTSMEKRNRLFRTAILIGAHNLPTLVKQT
ncbi:hypothetical protein T265_10494 [Opisthorchis viverrini]|uniref:Uncharacterized protein n=1 Tax=Opisthorchis viverrini TaxID=6198 RepID=A0A075A140_OPIVI|nr:hypothetical protein T265_10494 [Opisthorchis viverrini]KER21114.1 hypothetical protein T265_10494 [Opisthorchis viverrini]